MTTQTTPLSPEAPAGGDTPTPPRLLVAVTSPAGRVVARMTPERAAWHLHSGAVVEVLSA